MSVYRDPMNYNQSSPVQPMSPLEETMMSSMSSSSMSDAEKLQMLQSMSQGSGALARAIQQMLQDPSVKAELQSNSPGMSNGTSSQPFGNFNY